MEFGMRITSGDCLNLIRVLEKIKPEELTKEEANWLENIKSRLVEKLNELIKEIDKRFKIRKQKFSQHTWSLVRWNNGYFSIKVTDDWHKWFDKGIKEKRELYSTPKLACIEFLKWVDFNEINLMELQSED